MGSTNNTTPTWKQFNRPWYLKFLYSIGGYFKNVGLMLWRVIKAIPFKIWGFILGIGLCFRGLWFRFRHGDWRTKVSYLIMGFGCFSRSPKQIVKGLLLFAIEALFVLYMVLLGGPNLARFGTLGTVEFVSVNQPYDNSLTILLYSVLAIILIIAFAYMYVLNTKIAYNTQKMVEAGKPLTGFKQQLNYALNDGYNVTILILPILGVFLITILPLMCNILVAFTSFDGKHLPPQNLFGWVGMNNFKSVFTGSDSTLIWRILGWTLIWAVFATFSNFFFGMFLAMIINKKSIKLKVFWRTCFIIVIAIPDFITLLMMSNFFSSSDIPSTTGPFNLMLQQWFGIKDANFDFFGTRSMKAMNARIMIIVVNLWRGMPYTMLATYGILMNIPDELYESSKIDGAGPVRRFVSITFPYIMFVMAPQLITTFTGNLNNFNVIFFLTGGGPTPVGSTVGSTDLLITYLYKLTINGDAKRYGQGAVLGIFMFLISSFFALIVFNSSKSNTQEDTFQ
ncbi:MAG: sugar ABC transporter permease [Roseburia sp.]|nr:sugar ABC transporter permease [Roseburia sp.]